MLAYALEWANPLVRWLHVTAAIAWIGTSFSYIALDYHLLEPKNPAAEEAGVAGEVWEIHGGGFYRVEKYRVAPRTLPSPLHWFQWEAYTTWLSGFGLLIVLYYANASWSRQSWRAAILTRSMAFAANSARSTTTT